MRLLKGSAADSEVGDGLMGLWSDGRPTESYPEAPMAALICLLLTIRENDKAAEADGYPTIRFKADATYESISAVLRRDRIRARDRHLRN
jgi:hypothetical protein